MDYEKKYKEALDRAKSMYESSDEAELAAYIFPELRESEDERIRKAIVETIKQCPDTFLNPKNRDEMVSYLEKQKEQKPHLELKAGKWYICHRAFCARADHLTVKEGERFQCEKDGIVKGFVIKEPEKYFKECGAPVPMEDEQKEQKPAEWSEEDADILNCCISSIEEAKENRYAYKETDGDTSYDREIDWLKSLRPSWKPSEEQMKMLAMFANLRCASRQEAATLESLYNDLKKLM